MAFIDDLKTGLEMFKQNAQELSFMNALQGANQQVSQIKASAMKEEEKRAALSQISNELVTRMAATGVPATTMQLISGAVGPKQFANADQMIQEGILTGNNELKQMGMETEQAQLGNQLRMLKEKSAIDEASQKRLFEHQLALQDKRDAAKAKKQLGDGVIQEIQKFDVAEQGLQEILADLEDKPGLKDTIGPLAGNTFDIVAGILSPNVSIADTKDFRAKVLRWAQSYRRAITGMAASIPELKEMPLALPSITDTPEAFKTKTLTLLSEGRKVKGMFLDNFEKAGRDVSRFRTGAAPAAPPTGAPQPGTAPAWLKPYKR